jgi:hypothetical protein
MKCHEFGVTPVPHKRLHFIPCETKEYARVGEFGSLVHA